METENLINGYKVTQIAGILVKALGIETPEYTVSTLINAAERETHGKFIPEGINIMHFYGLGK